MTNKVSSSLLLCYMYLVFIVAVILSTRCVAALDQPTSLKEYAAVRTEGQCVVAEPIPNVHQENGVSSTNTIQVSESGCDIVEVLKTNAHKLEEGIYEESATLRCEGVPVWVQLSSKDMNTVHYLYRLKQQGIYYWAIGDVWCSSTVYAIAKSNSLVPGGVAGWREAKYVGFETSNMVVRCREASCDSIELRKVPSTHSQYGGVYTRDGVCAYRPSYKNGSYNVYYAILTSFSGWIATEDACTRSTVSVSLRNLENTAYPEDLSSNWQYYLGQWRTTDTMDVKCTGATHQHCGAIWALLPICIAIALRG